jgi:peptide deformylase
MILPIYVYGSEELRQPTVPVTRNTDTLQKLIDDMIQTMHGASGIGLAAPQVGRSERLFVVDLTPIAKDAEEPLPVGPIVFINPEIVDEGDELVEFEEGCLSIPDLREYVERPTWVRVRYQDRHLEVRELEAHGMLARVIQHEYDHLEGVLFIDLISPFRRRLLNRRLRDMANGVVEADYPLKMAV